MIQLNSHVFFYLLQFVHDITLTLTGPGSGQSISDNDIVNDKDDVIIDNNNKNNVKKNTTNNDHANHDRALST